MKVKLSKYIKTLDHTPLLKDKLIKIANQIPSARAIILTSDGIPRPTEVITVITNDPTDTESLKVITDLINFIPRRNEILLTSTLQKTDIATVTATAGALETKIIYKYGRPTKYDTSTADKIQQLTREGKSIRKIAKELNMSPTTVQKLKNASENCKLSEVFDPQNQAV